MLYQKANTKDGQIVITESKQIDQNSMTTDCWLIQFDGLLACKTCESKGTSECGGGETLKRLKENIK